MKKQAGFLSIENYHLNRNDSQFYRIGLPGGAVLLGVINEENHNQIMLLPHIVGESFPSHSGDKVRYRLEKSTPAEIFKPHVIFKQPVQEDFINAYLNPSETFYENGSGI